MSLKKKERILITPSKIPEDIEAAGVHGIPSVLVTSSLDGSLKTRVLIENPQESRLAVHLAQASEHQPDNDGAERDDRSYSVQHNDYTDEIFTDIHKLEQSLRQDKHLLADNGNTVNHSDPPSEQPTAKQANVTDV